MRLLFAGPLPPRQVGGSISRGVLVTAFAKAGVDMCCLSAITAEGLRGGDRFAAEHPEIRVVRYLVESSRSVAYPPTEDEIAIERRALETLVPRAVSSFHPDLLVAGYETLARYLPDLAREHRRPSVLLARGNPTCHMLSGQYENPDKETLLAGFRKFDRIVSVADFMTAGFRGFGCRNVTTVPNAIDTAVFSPRGAGSALRAEWNIPAGHSIVLVSGQLDARKRPADVVHSASLVLAKRPGVTYLFAGQGHLRESIERMVMETGWAAKFRFTGWLEYERMADVVNLADVVVMATEAEGMARSYLEAMACGKTLIASDIPPARELIQHGRNGLLFPLGDVERLAARTLEALDDADLRARLGRHARDSVAWRNLEHVVPLYLNEFRLAIDPAG